MDNQWQVFYFGRKQQMSDYKSPVTGATIKDYLEEWLGGLTEDEYNSIYKRRSEEQESEDRRKGITK
jgi:hypothetical protein